MVFTSCARNGGSILTLCSMIKCQVERRNASSYRLQLVVQCEKGSSFWSLGSRVCLLYLSLLSGVSGALALLGPGGALYGEGNHSQFVCVCACMWTYVYTPPSHLSKSSGAVRPYYRKHYTLLLHLLYRTWKYSVSSGYLRASWNQDFYLVCVHLCKFLAYGLLDLLPGAALLLPTTRSP